MTTKTPDLTALSKLDGLITADVGEYLYMLASKTLADQHIVEIGAWKGKSTCYLAAGRRDGNGGRVFSVDPWSTDVQEWSRYHQSATLEQWQAQVDAAGFTATATPLPGRSVDVADRWAGGPIGFLYIDGDHARAAVLTDWEAWRPHLSKTAVVVFDDYGVSHNPDVAPVVHELQKSGDLIMWEIAAGGRVAVCQVAS